MSEENILNLPGLQQGIPMSEASICEAVGEKPAVVNRQIFDLVITGRLVRRCGVGSSPAMYFLPQEAKRAKPPFLPPKWLPQPTGGHEHENNIL